MARMEAIYIIFDYMANLFPYTHSISLLMVLGVQRQIFPRLTFNQYFWFAVRFGSRSPYDNLCIRSVLLFFDRQSLNLVLGDDCLVFPVKSRIVQTAV